MSLSPVLNWVQLKQNLLAMHAILRMIELREKLRIT